MRLAFAIVAGTILLVAHDAAADSQVRPKIPPQPMQQTTNSDQTTTQDQRGTEKTPLAVKVIPTEKTKEEAAAEKAEREEKSLNDSQMIKFTAGLVVVGVAQSFIFILQLVVFGLQARRLRQSIEKMDEVAAGQTQDMAKAIAESAKAAIAMDSVAASMAENVEAIKKTVATNREIADRQKLATELQLRAYVSVTIAGGTYQERDKNLRFEGKPRVLNSGQTEAKKLAHTINAGILPVPLPKDYVLATKAIPDAEEGVIPAHQDRYFSCIVSDFVPDEDVKKIMGGDKRALYVWGCVVYEDVFGESRRTEFCHQMTFVAKNDGTGFIVDGYYIPGRNTAT